MVLLEKIYFMHKVNVGNNKCNCVLANVSFIGLLGNYQRADCATLLTVVCYICTIHCHAPLCKVMTNLRLHFSAHVLKC